MSGTKARKVKTPAERIWSGRVLAAVDGNTVDWPLGNALSGTRAVEAKLSEGFSHFGLFDVSSGIADIAERCGDEVDHGDEGFRVSVAAGSCPGGLEKAVEAFQAGVGVC